MAPKQRTPRNGGRGGARKHLQRALIDGSEFNPKCAPASICEEHALGLTPRQPRLDWLKANGIPALNLAKTWCGTFDFVLSDCIAFIRAGFEFTRHLRVEDDAVSALTFLARDELSEPADIVAWHPETGRFASWLGRVALLGQEQVFAPRLSDALTVHPRPLEWLAAGRHGVVIVDARRATLS
jgi:hypothetical protein